MKKRILLMFMVLMGAMTLFGQPYTLCVENNNSFGTITVRINGSPVTLTTGTDYDSFSPIYSTDRIEVTCTATQRGDELNNIVLDQALPNEDGSGFYPGGWLMTIPYGPQEPYSRATTVDIPTLGDMFLRAEYAPHLFKIDVMPLSHGYAEAWEGVNGTMQIDGIGNYPHYGMPIELKDYPDPGYELDHYVIWGANNGRRHRPLFRINAPYNDFQMPESDVIVVPHFKKKIFYVHYDCALGNGDMYAWNLDTNVGGVSGGVVTSVFPATIGQRIRLAAEPYPIAANLIFNYFYLDQLNHPQYGQVRKGEMRYRWQRSGTWYTPYNNNPPNNHSESWYIEEFTMPPFDLFAHAKIADGWGDYEPFPITNDLLLWGRDNNTGAIMLHNMPPVKSPMRSTGWDDPENYGWASAVPGQPMFFTVAPNLGYQVKKSDITVRLYDMSQGEEGQLFRVLRGSDGEIDGPDEEITGPTDFSFIFDVPEGVEPSMIRLDIDAGYDNVYYTITVADGIEHGTVEVAPSAMMDETVAVTVTPEPGYRLASLFVTPETPGFFTEDLENGQFVMPASNVILYAEFEEAEFQPGDVNGDGMIGIADVTDLIDYILGNDPQPFNYEAGDVTGDGIIGIADVTTLIDYILLGTW